MVKEFNTNFRVGQGGIQEFTSDESLSINNKPRLVLVDASSGPVTITLFKAVGLGGKRICILKTDSSGNAVTVTAAAGDTVNGAATDSITDQFQSVDFISDNENEWLKVGTAGGPAPGGGAWQKVAEDTLSSPALTMTATPASAITPGSVSEIYVIVEFEFPFGSPSTAVLSFGGISATIKNVGLQSNGTTVVGFSRSAANIGSGLQFTVESPIRIVFRIGINNWPIGGISGDFVETNIFGGVGGEHRAGVFAFDSTFTSITNFVLTATQNFVANSRMKVFTLQN